MVRHIVMWKFKNDIKEADKTALKEAMATHLGELKGKVPGLLEVSFIKEPIASSTHDIALLSVHDSKEALVSYASHPDHVKVADMYVRPYVEARCCLDYEDE